jgi:hypothetical protein
MNQDKHNERIEEYGRGFDVLAAWRWDRDDQFPNGRRAAAELLSEQRTALERYGLDTA